MKRGIMLMLGIWYAGLFGQSDAWTWHYHKVVPDEQARAHSEKRELIFTKQHVPLFTQLVFSWNAFRPQKGYYTFYMQTRDATTQSWSRWHKMVDWGDCVQCSYESSSDGKSRYVYVRLETEQQRKGDAFRIKVVAHKQADLSQLRGFTVNASDLHRFQPESIAFNHLPSVYIDRVPKFSQLQLDHEDCRTMCSPTSCSMWVSYLTKRQVHPIAFAEASFDKGLKAYGSWPFNMAHAFELAGGAFRFYAGRLHSFSALHSKLLQGTPVVVSVRGDLQGAPKSYANGHLMVVVGFDAQKNVVICHDPAAESARGTYKKYPVESFVRAWERSRRLSYVAQMVQQA